MSHPRVRIRGNSRVATDTFLGGGNTMLSLVQLSWALRLRRRPELVSFGRLARYVCKCASWVGIISQSLGYAESPRRSAGRVPLWLTGQE
jgi:hypothetical protein